MPSSRSDLATEPSTSLHRAISSKMLLVFVVGDILGAGIYGLVGQVAGRVGGAIWASFLVAMTLAFFTAFAYAELVTKYPDAAGAALYVNKAFRRPFVTFMAAFVVAVSGITSASTAARLFGGTYLAALSGVEVNVALAGLGFVAVLALINFRGIRESVKVNLTLTAIELGGLLLIIGIGAAALLRGIGEPARAFTFADGDGAVPVAILGGATLAFFSFLGFEDSVNLAEETREPSRAYPRALFAGLLFASVVYLLVAFTAGMVVPTDVLARSDAPLLEVVRAGQVSVPPRLFSLLALVAVSNTALINLIMASRLLYGMANQRIVPSVLGRVHAKRRTPLVAIVFVSLIAAVLVLTGELGTLARTTVVLLLIVFTVVNIAVLVLRSDRVEHRHFRAPTILPVLGAASCAALLSQQTAAIWARTGLLALLGLALWGVNHLIVGKVEAIDAAQLMD
ncbi:MAG: APC family permease [Pseudonocardiaceae bacterium]